MTDSLQQKAQFCFAGTVAFLQAAFDGIIKFADEVRANSEDDDTMVSLEQLEKERSYESIDYHKSHTQPYCEWLKRKRVAQLIQDSKALSSRVLSSLPPTRVHALSQNEEENSNSSPGSNNIDNNSPERNPQSSGNINIASSSSKKKKKSTNETSAFDDVDDNEAVEAALSKEKEAAAASSSLSSSNINNFNNSNNTAASSAENENTSATSSPFQSPRTKVIQNYLSAVSTSADNLASQMEHRPQLIRWIMHIIVALCVGCFVATVSQTTGSLEEWRLSTLESMMMKVRRRGDSYFLAQFEGLVWWLFSAVLLVGVGTAVVVFIEPVAGGSGLPQVMAYLNGVLVRNIFSLKTFVVKTISVIGAVAGGLPCGAEAPFVHLGASIGAGVSAGRSRTLGFQTDILQTLRGSKDRRDFTTAGAACGVAAAFGSPIGGMLFVMEEAAVMWDLITTTQIFLGSMTAFTAMAILDSVLGSVGHGYVSRAVSVMFQVKYAGTIPLNITAVIPAIALGAICGLLTVVFTKMNLYFVKMRQRYISHSTLLKLLEPIIVVIIFATINFVIPQVLPCRDLISHDTAAGKLNGTQVDTAAAWFTENNTVLSTYMCSKPDKEYSPLATLSTGLGKRSIRRLLSRRTVEEFPFYAIFIFFILYFTFATYVNGSAIASGLIIPFIVMGSAVGRMFGLIMVTFFATDVVDQQSGEMRSAYFLEDSWMDPGVYALIGAGAFVGGATRMTISVPVIMVELSGELRFLLPIMVAIAVARAIADTLCVPLYHQLLHLVCVPYLPHSAKGVNLDLFTLRELLQLPAIHHRVEESSDKKENTNSNSNSNSSGSKTEETQQQQQQQSQEEESLSENNSNKFQRKVCWLSNKPTLREILDLLIDTKHHLFPVLELLPIPTMPENLPHKDNSIEMLMVETNTDKKQQVEEEKKKPSSSSKVDDDFLFGPLQSASTTSNSMYPSSSSLSNNKNKENTTTAAAVSVSSSAATAATETTTDKSSSQQQQQVPLNSAGLPPHRFIGTVTREDLQVMLALPDFDISPLALTRFRPSKPYHQLRYEEWIEHENSMFFLLSTQQWQQMWNTYVPNIPEEKAQTIVDLNLILNRSPFVQEADTTLSEAFNYFRTMCLRHLIVVDDGSNNNNGNSSCRSIVGIVTRKDLLPYRLRQLQSQLDSRLLDAAGLKELVDEEEEELRHQHQQHSPVGSPE